MNTLREAAQQALEALEATYYDVGPAERQRLQAVDAITALRAALAQQEDIAQNLQSRLDAAMLLEERRQEIAQPHRETEQEPTVRIKCTVVDNQHPSGVPFEQWVNAPRREWQSLPACEDKPHAVLVDGYGYVDVRAVRAIEQVLRSKNDAVR